MFLNKILCHHFSEEKDHCIKIRILTKDLLVCSRCLGLYPLTLIWLILSAKFQIKFSYPYEKGIILYTLLPAFLDWALTSLKFMKSNNNIRLFTGMLASFGLSRYLFLWIYSYQLNAFYYITKIYGIALIIMGLLIFKQKVIRH